MRNKLLLGLAVAAAGFAGSAKAQTFVGPADAGEGAPLAGLTDTNSISQNTVWTTGAANPAARIFACPIVLNEVIFVESNATLTIQPGCVVRGQPRQAAPTPNNPVGSPGALVVTTSGQINAVGTAANPIIFTTAAVDADANGVADVSGSFKTPYNGTQRLLDNDPLNFPLSPLNPNGTQNTALWGGAVILGNAPTNLSNQIGVGHGRGLVEGLNTVGYGTVRPSYGGTDPNDNSGRLAYASIRHGGDEVGASNELNCLTLGAIGALTTISYIDCYVNYDDGVEIFGGTVDTDHILVSYVGDDMFDLDQGYTGLNQFWMGIQGAFNENGGGSYGTSSGDKGGEWDGDDYRFATTTALGAQVNLSTRFQQPGTISPTAAPDGTPWPLSAYVVTNMTLLGPGGVEADGLGNPAVSDVSGSGRRGIDFRNGCGGKLLNSMVVNYGAGVSLDVRNGDGTLTAFQCETNASVGLVTVATSNFIDGAAMGAPENTALANGNALAPLLGASAGTDTNCVTTDAGAGGDGLFSENSLIVPTGGTGAGAPGKLVSTLLAQPIDPRPNASTCSADGVPPQKGLGAVYRGAVEPFAAELWTNGWTALNRAGLLAN